MRRRDDDSSALEGARELELAALVEAFEEARRADRGGNSVESWIARYPAFADELRELLPGVVLMESMASETSDAAARRAEVEAVPEAIGAYRIIRRVGRGGMGIVYLAEQASLGREVALKVLPANVDVDRGFRARFQREARAAAQLEHPNIVPVYEAGHADGRHFFAMRFIDGQSLDERLRDMRAARARGERATEADPQEFNLREAVRLAAGVASALEHAHQAGVLHRDIKPGNVLFDQSRHPWVTDFGLCRMEDAGNLTSDGAILGTLRYMAPEQIEGAADERSDVYGVGLLLFELLTLRPAFDSVKRTKVIHDVLHTPVPRLRKLRPDAPRSLEILVRKATAKLPQERYPSASALLRDLTAFEEDRPISAQPPSALYLARLFVTRHRLASAVALVAVCLLGLLGTLYVRDLRASEARSERRAYVGDLAAAEAALREGAIERARFHLDRAPEGLRSWEWRHLDARVDQSVTSLRLGGGLGRMSLAPDGRRMAVSDDRGIHVVTLPEMTVEVTVRCSRAGAVAWDATGDRLAVALSSGELRIYDATPESRWDSYREVRITQETSREPKRLLFAGDTVVAGTRSGFLYAWRPPSGDTDGSGQESVELLDVLAGEIVELGLLKEKGAPWFYAVSAFGQVVSCDGRRMLDRFDFPAPQLSLRSIRFTQRLEEGVYVTHAGSAVAFSDRGQQSQVLYEGQAILNGVDVAGDLVCAVGNDRILHMMDLKAGAVIRELKGSQHPLVDVAVIPESPWIVTLGENGLMRLWDMRYAGGGLPLTGHLNDVNSLSFDAAGRRLVTGGRDGVVALWDVMRAEAIEVFTDPLGTVGATAFAGPPGAERVVAGTLGGHVFSWDVGQAAAAEPRSSQGEVLTARLPGASLVEAVRDEATGDVIFATNRGLFRVDPSLASLAQPEDVPPTAPSRGSSPGLAWTHIAGDDSFSGVSLLGDLLVGLTIDGRVLVFDRESGDLRRETATGQRSGGHTISTVHSEIEVFGGASSEMGIFVTGEQKVMAIDLLLGELRELTSGRGVGAQQGEVFHEAAWIDGGRRFLVSTRNGLLSVWSTQPVEHLVDLRGHERWAMRMKEAPRTGVIASLSSFGGLRIWNTLSTADWAERASGLESFAGPGAAIRMPRSSAAELTRAKVLGRIASSLESRVGRLLPRDWMLLASLYRDNPSYLEHAVLYAVAFGRFRRDLEVLALLEAIDDTLSPFHRLRPLLDRTLRPFWPLQAQRDAYLAEGRPLNGVRFPTPKRMGRRASLIGAPFFVGLPVLRHWRWLAPVLFYLRSAQQETGD